MRKLRATESSVRGVPRSHLDKNTEKAGEAKLITIRSPIGIIDMARRQLKLMLAISTLYTTRHTFTL